ncbi:hypothetical protein AB3U99_21875 [Niallia sp. JL1B1071]|uniref:hypothetical protein n=1 Tax=Niallia tiangongensis TaxID=3237105 RepID=UPI0037DC1DB7
MFEHKEGNLVACICEGNAEQEIMEILLENGKLKFQPEDLLDERLFTGSMRSSRNLERRYLTQNYKEGQKIEIIRILDSRNESYKIADEFKGKLASITNCYTRPEIELLIILHKGHYDKFMRSKYKKPSDYCIHDLNLGKKIKSKAFISNYFQDPEELVQVLEIYHRVRSDEECTIFSLLK